MISQSARNFLRRPPGSLAARALPALLAVPLALTTAAPASGLAGAAGHPGACSWRVIPSPSPGTARNILFAVTAPPRGNINQLWAVGDRISPEATRMVAPVADHWNGSSWHATVLPGKQSNLLGLYSTSASNVWAVGFYIIALDHTLPVIDHFAGHSWVTVPSPRVDYGVLSGVAGTSASNIWAVGRKLGRPAVTLIEHYNGHVWTRVKSPSPAAADYIDFGAIKVLSRNDIWVAGDYVTSSGVFRTLIEHYDGQHWKIVRSPNVGSRSNYLAGIAALGPHQVWAVGRAMSGSRFVPIAMTWNGHAWHSKVLPAGGSGDNALNGLAAMGRSTMWAVGSFTGPSGNQLTLVERYSNGHWRIEPSPNANPTADNILYAAAVIAQAKVWAVGSWTSPSKGKSVTIRRCLP